jgi:carbon-monoxide dehydrogenase large subunit
VGRRWSGLEAPKIGDAVPRKEDLRLLTGLGRFSDDETLPNALAAAIVRSQHPHALIDSINVQAALAMPGVHGVLIGTDAVADGLNSVPHSAILSGSFDIHLHHAHGAAFVSQHHILPTDRVRYLGEPVAIVIAESVAAAKDAAGAVLVQYSPLPFTLLGTQARANSSLIHPEAKSNVALNAQVGDMDQVDRAFRQAAHVVELKTWIQRVTGVPMEPRAALATYDANSGAYTLRAGSGNVVRQRRELATVLGVDESCVRVVAQDVGGNFGTRNAFYVEFALIAWAARRFGRPVKWTCDRSEAFLSDYAGRDLEVTAELALDERGTFLAMRSCNVSNVGAYSVSYGPLTKGVELMTSVYRVPVAHIRGQAVFTNTTPTNSYRSSGRPEAMFVMERLIDLAAQRMGVDRIDIRRRNLIPSGAASYTNAMGLTYDRGAYETTMDRALARADWNGFIARRAQAAARGRLRGIGVANYIEIASGIPRERAELTISPLGYVEIVIGTISSGQGHETSFAQVVTTLLCVGFDEVKLVTGDTQRVKAGGGSHAGRSMRLAGVVIGKAAVAVLEKARRIAGHALGADPDALHFADGRFYVAQSNTSINLYEIAMHAERDADLPAELRGPLAATCDEVAKAAGFPFGSHVCEVEIDPETGCLQVVNYVAVDDVGRAVNPLILHGQTYGGIAQGLGQALGEICRYDETSGQLLSGSFMDYVMPRAHTMPPCDVIISETPAESNPLGIRAGGEGGTTPALAVLVNATVDALRDYGVTHLEMPITSERIWRAIRSHGRQTETT